jgi:hypothetical protein
MNKRKYNLGGDLLAGAAGVLGGAASTVPLVGPALQQGVYNMHSKLDKDITEDEMAVRGYSSAAGAMGAGLLTGNPTGAIKGAASGLQSGIEYTQFQFGGSPMMMGQPQYEAEGGEVVTGGQPQAMANGQAIPTSSQSATIQGPSHEQGGVDMSGGERVYSDALKVPLSFSKEIGYTGKTYANIADKITKKIGKLEEQLKSGDSFAKESAKQSIPKLQEKLDTLFTHQETTKQASFQKDYSKLQMKYGGMLPKYVLGGSTNPPPFEEWLKRHPFLFKKSKELQTELYNEFLTKYTPEYDEQDKIKGYNNLLKFVEVNPEEYSKYLPTTNNSTTEPSPNNPQSSSITNPVLPGENWQQYRDRVLGPDAPEAESMALLNDFNTFIASPDNNVQYGQTVSNTRNSNRPSALIETDLSKDFASDAAVKQADGTYLTTYGVDGPAADWNIGGNNTSTADAATPPPPGVNPTTWQDALYKGAVFAPTAYNLVRGLQKPQSLDHEQFQNPYEQRAMDMMANRRYNIDPILQSNRSSFNNLKETIKSASGGNSGAYLSNIGMSQINKDRADATAWATKNNYDNQYLGEEANMMSSLGANRAQTKFSIQDINDRNRAARNAFLGAAATGVSNIAQNERHMANLANADNIRATTLDYMNPNWGYEKDDKGAVTGKLTYKNN